MTRLEIRKPHINPMKKIILCTDGSTYSETTYQYGAWFAKQLPASVDVLYVTEKSEQTKRINRSGSLGFNASDDLLKRIVAFEHDYAKIEQEKSKEILNHAQDYFEAEGLDTNTYTHHQGDLLADLKAQESNADLIILGKCGSTGLDLKQHLGSHVEQIMRSLHSPCLVTAQHYHPIEHVMLAYDDSPPCRVAFQQILQLPFIKTIPLHLVQVAKKSDETSVEKRLESLRIEAQELGVEASVTILKGAIEDELHQYIQSHKISLLVMGVHGNRPLRNLIMGHTASHMITETDIPVLLYR